MKLASQAQKVPQKSKTIAQWINLYLVFDKKTLRVSRTLIKVQIMKIKIK